VRHSFQKNRPHPPEPAVGNNTGTSFKSPHAARSAGFFMIRIPMLLSGDLQGKDYFRNRKDQLMCVLFIAATLVSTL
jgi:hypothetical protein